MKKLIFLTVIFFLIPIGIHSAGSLDLDKLCDQMYKIYDSDELPAKKEVLAYKKLNELIGQSVTVKITTTDSIKKYLLQITRQGISVSLYLQHKKGMHS
jgi:hypothetical protein